MAVLLRWMRLGYVVGFAALVLVLAAPRPSRGQFFGPVAPVSPFLGLSYFNMAPSLIQAQSMLRLAGTPLGMGLSGGFAGFQGGFRNLTFAGGFGVYPVRFSSFSGYPVGFGGFTGYPFGFGGFGGFPVGFGGYPVGFGGFAGFGGSPVGYGNIGGFSGFAGKSFGGFNGKKPL